MALQTPPDVTLYGIYDTYAGETTKNMKYTRVMEYTHPENTFDRNNISRLEKKGRLEYVVDLIGAGV